MRTNFGRFGSFSFRLAGWFASLTAAATTSSPVFPPYRLHFSPLAQTHTADLAIALSLSLYFFSSSCSAAALLHPCAHCHCCAVPFARVTPVPLLEDRLARLLVPPLDAMRIRWRLLLRLLLSGEAPFEAAEPLLFRRWWRRARSPPSDRNLVCSLASLSV